MKLRTLEYSVNATRLPNGTTTVTAAHPDGEVLQFHAVPAGTPGKISFISRDVISRMRGGDSAGARELMRAYTSVFSVHAASIEAVPDYRSAGFRSEAA
jgi:hypothetical protein